MPTPSQAVTSNAEADAAMNRYAAGDDGAFEAVYDHLGPRLYRYLLRLSRDRQLAEDLVQQTFLHIHRARGGYASGAQVTPWAFAIGRRLLIDELRRTRRAVHEALEDPSVLLSPTARADEEVQARQLAGRIQTALDALPPRQREAILLVRQEGLTQAEAAQALGTTVMAVKLLVHRGVERLRTAVPEVEVVTT